MPARYRSPGARFLPLRAKEPLMLTASWLRTALTRLRTTRMVAGPGRRLPLRLEALEERELLTGIITEDGMGKDTGGQKRPLWWHVHEGREEEGTTGRTRVRERGG